MIFEASFYLNEPASAARIMAFAKTFDGRLDRMTITDASLKSRSSRPDQDKIAQVFDAKYPPTQILLFQKGKDGNNNFPECYLMLNRVSAAEDRDHIFSLVAYVPAEDEQSLVAHWWTLAAEAGWKAGNGYVMRPPLRDINYGMFSASVPTVRTETWTKFDAFCRDFRRNRDHIQPVIEGKMLRNVLRHNFLTSSLAETVRDVLSNAGLPIGDIVPVAPDRAVWTVPEPESQRLAHDALHRQGLVWEPTWLDLAGYVPTR